MELLQLRYFLVAAKYEHMTKAAEALKIAQPALSQSIRRLEDELGISLFIREKRSVKLNETGKFLEQQLIPLLAALDELPAAVQERAAQTGHTIHLNLLAATKLVTDCIIAYKKQHPKIRFRLSQNPDMEKADLCVSTAFPGEQARDDSLLLMAESFYMAVPASSPFALLPSVQLSDLREEDFITLSMNRPIRRICDRYCLESGFTPRTICETDNPESVRNLIAAGLGVGFWPEYSWGPLVSPEIVFLPIEHPHCRRDIILTCRPREENGRAVAEFCRFLRGYAEEVDPHASISP